MFRKNNKNETIFEKRIRETKEIHEKLVKEEMNNLNETLRSKKFDVDTLISKSNLGNTYHDLIDSKDQLNSEYQSKFNQAYHSIDIELRKLNKKLDNETRKMDYNINHAKEKVINKVVTKVVG